MAVLLSQEVNSLRLIRIATWLALLILTGVHSAVFSIAQTPSPANPRLMGEIRTLLPPSGSAEGVESSHENSRLNLWGCCHPHNHPRVNVTQTLLQHARSLTNIHHAQFASERLSIVLDTLDGHEWGTENMLLLIEALPFKIEREIATAWSSDLKASCRALHSSDHAPP